MNCSEFESLMADALGDELSPQDQPAFEAHLSECGTCRAEYEGSQHVVRTMRSLPGPRQVVLTREADRLVLQPATQAERGSRPIRTFGVMRYAAGLLIAFTAGYALHAGITLTATPHGPAIVSTDQQDEPETGEATLRSTLAQVYVRNVGTSDLTKCLIAMARPRS